jgi:seryl-tRNA synthetase
MLPLTLDEKIDQTQKRLDNLSKILQDLERQIKYKPGEKPKVHSLRKKVKGLTTKLKKLQKLQSKKQKK